MKMQHTVTAPYDGTVTDLPVSVGDQVAAEAVLAVVHPREAVRRRPGMSAETDTTVPFTETDERRSLRREVAKLASGYGQEYFVHQARNGEKTTDLWLDMGRHGYLGVALPEEYGGGGGGIGDLAAVCEELAAQGCPC